MKNITNATSTVKEEEEKEEKDYQTIKVIQQTDNDKNLPAWLEMTTLTYNNHNNNHNNNKRKNDPVPLLLRNPLGIISSEQNSSNSTTTATTSTTATNTTDTSSSSFSSSSSSSSSSFQRHKGVVIVTKVHWAQSIQPLKRMLCTIHAAYNQFVHYDIVVFTTIPWTQQDMVSLAKVVSPASLTVALDGPPLQEQLKALSEEEYKALRKRCHVVDNQEELTWFHHCEEENYGTRANLAYSWQSEFRAYHIWNHPALKKYKWMIWMDSDAICTKTWEKDPIQYMVENNLTVLYDNFPAGSTKGLDFKEKMIKAYGYAICGIWEKDDGTWFTRTCREVDVAWVNHIHGFHHVTNLDVYRSDRHMSFLKLMVGDYRFSRKWDDQLAVTVPAAFEAPERVWDMRKHNMIWNIRHNGEYDGKEKYKVKNPIAWWRTEGRLNWEAGRILCDECFDIKKV